MAKQEDPTQATIAQVSSDQTNTSEVTQTPGADIDQPVPEPERKGAAGRASVPYTQVTTPAGDVISTQPDNDKAVDSA